MKARYLVLLDPAGNIVRKIDISDLDNTNTQSPFMIAIEEYCDMNYPHLRHQFQLTPWGAKIR
jgi:hypothetical protein